jgi:UDP-N-acetylglucosamine 2-epimerase (non-hydrolysing)
MLGGSTGEPKTVMVVYGTRPEAIKLAPLIRALAASEHLKPLVVVTGQHREMLDQVNALFSIVPDVDLDLMDHGASVNAIARRVLKRVEEQIVEHRPDALVVQGDTTSAFAASLAAFLEDVPVIHLEAGLRTGNRRSPFPEEANRQLTSVVTDLHLAPTSVARANLEAEGVDATTIVVTGNTVVDALQWAVTQPVTFADSLVEKLGTERDLILVTTHRREAWGDRMLAAMRGLGDVVRNHPELDLLLPMHRNPIVRDTVIEVLGKLPNVHLTEPLSYAEFCHVMKRSRLIVTDSGGIQEEAPSLGKPVLVLRDTTERPEGVDAGTVKVIGTDQATVTQETERLLTDPDAYAAMANAVNPYGDGHAAPRAVQAIEALLIGGERPEEFRP